MSLVSRLQVGSRELEMILMELFKRSASDMLLGKEFLLMVPLVSWEKFGGFIWWNKFSASDNVGEVLMLSISLEGLVSCSARHSKLLEVGTVAS